MIQIWGGSCLAMQQSWLQIALSRLQAVFATGPIITSVYSMKLPARSWLLTQNLCWTLAGQASCLNPLKKWIEGKKSYAWPMMSNRIFQATMYTEPSSHLCIETLILRKKSAADGQVKNIYQGYISTRCKRSLEPAGCNLQPRVLHCSRGATSNV